MIVSRQLSVVSCQHAGSGIGDRKPGICNPQFSPRRRGMTLIEVLASIGVLTIGLLGLAALLPVGWYTINEATKADRTGDCGRAAMRDVAVRRMLEAEYWRFNGNTINQIPTSFLIDPRGVLGGLNQYFGNGATSIQRFSLVYEAPSATPSGPPNPVLYTQALANQVFVWPDDLVVEMPEDMHPPQAVGRPSVMVDPTTNGPSNVGDYSWFASVVPDPSNPNRFTVSIVVCCKRDLSKTAERAVPIPQGNFFDNGVGGGSVQLAREINDIGSDNPPAGIAVKENDWVALCSASGLIRWYRIGSIGDDSSYLTLIGPDWTPATQNQPPDQLVALGQSVIGVYTTTIELDTDPTWTN